MSSFGRCATLVLVTPDGVVIGSLPPLELEAPWWQEASDVVREARRLHAIEVTVLRLLSSEHPTPPGGHVTYLAEVPEAPAGMPLEPWFGELDDPLQRMPWARPGGPSALLAWAGRELAAKGLSLSGPPEQVRTWNLSTLWRLPTEHQTVWLKAVPPFFAHEPALLAELQGCPVPRLLAWEAGKMLLAEVPGEDLYDASVPRLFDMVTLLVEVQRDWVGRTEELLALGLPDWRSTALMRAIREVLERTAPELAPADRRPLEDFVERLPQRFADAELGSLPETLIHGDFHPGNLRGTVDSLALLDWGDASVGHPLLDQPAFLERIPPQAELPIREHWYAAWRNAVPGCAPEHAARLLAPIATARQAVIYQRFLDSIEPAEHGYHRADPAKWLARTAHLLRESG